ncbi:SidJ-related pseudokinase [Desulfolutivibrio sulfoxidireducens]|uniref:SidJ-related pseudokinase n=1 Tax=Desulfolutivibrio sulfoxidireducens TaxID=2773299 RepID=UPI00159EA61B|nr:SidJ-related pseudokinase [Desulfolutivibrio sulfoxidireducens]QLA21203.1 SidJ-related pseudokinase [Desulfolutivibrio sulfoxidireducens]
MTQHQGLDGTDFQAAYLAVRRLADITRHRPDEVTPEAVQALGNLLAAAPHDRQTQARFLYRDAATVLMDLFRSAPDRDLAARAFAGVDTALSRPGKPRLAAAEAVGDLPLCVRGPAPPEPDTGDDIPEVAWNDLLESASSGTERVRALGQVAWNDLLDSAATDLDGDGEACRPFEAGGGRAGGLSRAGRTLLAPLADGRMVFAVKFARRGEDPAGLAREAAWMDHLAALAPDLPARFHVPRPVTVRGRPVFRVQDAPLGRVGLDPATLADGRDTGAAMAYAARADYFSYPNEHGPRGGLSGEELLDVLAQNALLFGRLAARGIVHTAPIPLFHNRVQRERRSDAGLYDWRRMGRLDRWLFSTRFPNFGPSGLRDFEHFESHDGPTGPLYRRLGDHLLGLALVAGSYFRFKEPDRVGLLPDGRPVDARELFDPDLLAQGLSTVFRSYYEGFSGKPPAGEPPFDPPALAGRLVEEMGVDRYMVELLRVADQEAMSDARFVEFLTRRGMPRQEAVAKKRGVEDIALPTGPHLGEFNGPISAPELITFTAVAAAKCVAGRYFAQHMAQAPRCLASG